MTQAKALFIFHEINKIEAAIALKGWPHYAVDAELCMSRYREFVEARAAFMVSRGTTWEAFRDSWS
jgi:hypothetical protein